MIFIGIFIGFIVGYVICALMATSQRADDAIEKVYPTKKEDSK